MGVSVTSPTWIKLNLSKNSTYFKSLFVETAKFYFPTQALLWYRQSIEVQINDIEAYVGVFKVFTKCLPVGYVRRENYSTYFDRICKKDIKQAVKQFYVL